VPRRKLYGNQEMRRAQGTYLERVLWKTMRLNPSPRTREKEPTESSHSSWRLPMHFARRVSRSRISPKPFLILPSAKKQMNLMHPRPRRMHWMSQSPSSTQLIRQAQLAFCAPSLTTTFWRRSRILVRPFASGRNNARNTKGEDLVSELFQGRPCAFSCRRGT